jgi:hypothetical protein
MEVTVDGGSSNGVFAATVNDNDGMGVAASTAAAQLTTTTAIAAATIIQGAIVANAIVSLSLHPTAASVDDDHRQ